MSESGFLAQKPKSPAGLVIVIALHAAALTALALSKTPIERFVPTVIKIKHIPNPEPPPPNPEPLPETPKARERIETVPPVIPTPPSSDRLVSDPVPLPPFNPGPGTRIEPVPQPRPLPLPDPVRVEARMSSASILQPPYPPSEQRLDREGSVTIRLVIGADGRVKSADKVSATSDAFYRATERHALRHWRFHPATLDGRPVETTRTVTVDFVLDS